MTKLGRQKIFEKLERLKEYISYLKTLRSEAKSEAQFLADFHLFGNAERYLQLSAQSIIDSAHLVIIDQGIQRPDDNYEAVSLLRGQGIISESLADALTKMVGLRNILVHEYGTIDRKKVYEILTTRIGELEEFQKQILTHLS
ncbi:MAG: DUF86 domain-containing protein [Parcubacteria group bacterium]|nr:DUF86 domain-containing protein [Parcubacteria group bacterium]